MYVPAEGALKLVEHAAAVFETAEGAEVETRVLVYSTHLVPAGPAVHSVTATGWWRAPLASSPQSVQRPLPP